jgi:hypothetical protein
LLDRLRQALLKEALLQLLEFLRLHYAQGDRGGHFGRWFPFGS